MGLAIRQRQVDHTWYDIL